MIVTTEVSAVLGFIKYLVLKSTGFLGCVLYPGESLHVFGAVLTRLQVRLHDTLSDAFCETKISIYTHTSVSFHSRLFLVSGETERERQGVARMLFTVHHGSVILNRELSALQRSAVSATGSSAYYIISTEVTIFCTH